MNHIKKLKKSRILLQIYLIKLNVIKQIFKTSIKSWIILKKVHRVIKFNKKLG